MTYQKVKVSIHKNPRKTNLFKYTSIDSSTYQYSILMETRGDRGRGLGIAHSPHTIEGRGHPGLPPIPWSAFLETRFLEHVPLKKYPKNARIPLRFSGF